MDLGYMELGGGGVTVRIYFQQGFIPLEGQTRDDAPLVDGPRGYCLDLTNTSGQSYNTIVYGVRHNAFRVAIGQGNPVTSGAGKSRTAAEIAQAGFTTRGDCGMISLGEA